MVLGFISRRSLKALTLVGFVSLIAAGCTTSGNSFNTTAANQLVAGETTMADAVRILGADPVNTYRQMDGSVTSIWSHKNSVLTDAIYLNQEIWLAFGPDGRFTKVVKTHNLPPKPVSGSSSVRETKPVTLNTPPKPVVVAAPPVLDSSECLVVHQHSSNTSCTVAEQQAVNSATSSNTPAIITSGNADTPAVVVPNSSSPSAKILEKNANLDHPVVSYPVNSAL